MPICPTFACSTIADTYEGSPSPPQKADSYIPALDPGQRRLGGHAAQSYWMIRGFSFLLLNKHIKNARIDDRIRFDFTL